MADLKLEELPEVVGLVAGDILYVVRNPGTTGEDFHSTWANILATISTQQNLTDHPDVILTGVADGDVLVFSASAWRNTQIADPAIGTGFWSGSSPYIGGVGGVEVTETISMSDALNVRADPANSGRVQIFYTTTPVPPAIACVATFDITLEAPANNTVGEVGFSLNGATPPAANRLPFAFRSAGDIRSLSLTGAVLMANTDALSFFLFGDAITVLDLGITINAQSANPGQADALIASPTPRFS